MDLFGKKINNWYLVGGVAGVGVVVFIWKRNSAGGSTAASGGTVDPATGMPYSQDSQVDPATGLTYSDEAQQYGSVAAAEAALAGQSGFAPYPFAGATGFGGTAGFGSSFLGVTPSAGTSFASNADWAQAVTSGLAALGYSATDVSAALGLYFQHMPLGIAPDGVSYLSIVQSAVAEFGPPPVGTFTITGSGNGTGGPTPQPVQVRVPDVVGQPQEAAYAILHEAGLAAAGSPVVKGETLYVDSQSPVAGHESTRGTTVHLKSSPKSTVPHSPQPAEVTVPDVIGKEQSEAFHVLTSAGLHPAGPAPVHDKVHHVTAQNPKAGSRVHKGSTVHLTSRLS